MIDEIRDISASVWISASAGTGKTKSLIDRILALLLQNVKPDKILCLTYTNAAASEMLLRLSAYVKKMHYMGDDQLEAELLEMGFAKNVTETARSLYTKSLQIHWVQIQTIHSFCLNILEQFPLETGIFPGVKLIDEYQNIEFLNASFESVFKDPSYQKALEIVASNSTDSKEILQKIKSNSLKLQKFIAHYGAFQNTYAVFFGIDVMLLNSFLCGSDILPQLLTETFGSNYRNDLKEIADILINGSESDKQKAYSLYKSVEENTIEFLSVFLTKGDHSIKKSLCTKGLTLKYIELEERLKKAAIMCQNFYEIYSRYLFAKTNCAFFQIAEKVLLSFNKLKKINHCLDFNDLISMTSNLLHNIEWVMYKVDGLVDHILVDEAQDTSPEMWDIIKTITDEFFANYNSEKTIFVVGDEKQSIYSFQGADVKLFGAMHQYFKNRSLQNGQKFHDVILNKSFRTTQNILSFVDTVFENTFGNVQHFSNRKNCDGVIDFVGLFKSDIDEIKSAWESQSNINISLNANQKLADYLADFIDKIISRNTYVPSKNRSAIYSDFLILFQRRNDLMYAIASKLHEKNIPVSGIDKIDLKNSILVEDLITFAQFSIFPLDDLSCARVLKSPIIGCSEEDLMQISINRKDNYLWDYISSNEDFCSKYHVEILRFAISIVNNISVYDFFIQILNLGVKEKFLQRLGSHSVQDILHEFLSITLKYEANNTSSISSFLSWFDRFDHSIKRENPEAENHVKLMTVHASKGLQSPFVIIADSTFINNEKDYFLQSDDGVLIWNYSSDFPPNIISSMNKNNASSDEEPKRLLYVAMTRAEDFLCITGTEQKKAISENCWHQFILQKANIEINPENSDDDLLADDCSNVAIHQIGRYQYLSASNQFQKEEKSQELPNWFFQKIDSQPSETIKTNNEQNSQEIYGDAVHLLLNELPKYFCNLNQINFGNITTIAFGILNHFDIDIETKQQAIIEATNVIANEEFRFIFSQSSKGEVSFLRDSKEGRIDRLIVDDDKIIIVDFKTGFPSQTIPRQYIEQMQFYKSSISKIYQNKAISTYILWTKTLHLQKVV